MAHRLRDDRPSNVRREREARERRWLCALRHVVTQTKRRVRACQKESNKENEESGDQNGERKRERDRDRETERSEKIFIVSRGHESERETGRGGGGVRGVCVRSAKLLWEGWLLTTSRMP